MSFTLHGLGLGSGIAIGQAVLTPRAPLEATQHCIAPDQVPLELARLRQACAAVAKDLHQIQGKLLHESNEAHIEHSQPKFGAVAQELQALLEVHRMLLQDAHFLGGVESWITQQHYNAAWALAAQLDVLGREFDEMPEPYLRERKADVAQVVRRVLQELKNKPDPLSTPSPSLLPQATEKQPFPPQGTAQGQEALILVAHDLSPAEMLVFKQGRFAGFVADAGSANSHMAMLARSLDLPTVLGTHHASAWVRPGDCLVLDTAAGVLVINPSPGILAEYRQKQAQQHTQHQRCQARLSGLRDKATQTQDGQKVELLANIELPEDVSAAQAVGAEGIGLFRTEFLFTGRESDLSDLPDEETQYQAYAQVVKAMGGKPVTLRSVDVGADKPLVRGANTEGGAVALNPSMGLRGIRWSLCQTPVFLSQLRAVLRAAQHGPVQLLVPMLSHRVQIQQTLALIDQAKAQLAARGETPGPLAVGAMVEVPAAALTLPMFLRYFDFVSIGSNDLTQYTLAVDRADPAVANLYQPLHPAVLGLMAQTIAQCQAAHKPVSLCGDLAADPNATALLLGLGLRSFSVSPSQLLAVKEVVLNTDAGPRRAAWAAQVLAQDETQG